MPLESAPPHLETSEPPSDDTVSSSERSAGRRLLPYAIAGLAYLAMAAAMHWTTITSGINRSATATFNDNSLFAWFLEWPVAALRHGGTLFHSSQMLHPIGINMLANTSVLGIGVPLLPLTILAGPFSTLNVALIASPVMSGMAAMWVARRWVTSPLLGALVGALFGFSPLVLAQSAPGHLNLVWLVVPPLVLACLDELFWRRRHSPIAVGSALGLLVIWQFFISTEMLAMMVVVTCLSLGLFVVVGLLHDAPATARSVRQGLPGALIALIGAGVVLAYPAAYALNGPEHYTGALWPYIDAARSSIQSFFVLTTSSPAVSPAWQLTQPTYVGPAILITLALGLVAFWRDRRLRAACALSAIVAWCSLGSSYSFGLWHWIGRIGPLVNIENQRFSALIFLPVGLALAIIIEHLMAWRRDGLGVVVIVVVVVASIAPLAWNGARALPYKPGTAIYEPPWYRAHAAHLGANEVLLSFPFPPVQSAAAPLGIQALSQLAYASAGARGPSELAARQGSAQAGYLLLEQASFPFVQPSLPSSASPTEVAAVRSALVQWGVTLVVLPMTRWPSAHERDPAAIDRWMTSILGLGHVEDGSWVWRLPHR